MVDISINMILRRIITMKRTHHRTPFGVLMNQLRAAVHVNLGDMAESIDVSASYLSAVEVGKRPVSPKILNASIEYFSRLGVDAKDLQDKADESNNRVNVEVASMHAEDRLMMASFARQLPSMSKDKKEQIQALMSES